MTTARSIVCGSCGSDVPYGRLSCPACGDLLASVAGGTRRAAGASTSPATSAGATTAAATTSGGERVPPSVLHDATEPEPMATLAFDDEPLASAREAIGSMPPDSAPLRAAPAWMAPGGVAVGGLFDDDDGLEPDAIGADDVPDDDLPGVVAEAQETPETWQTQETHEAPPPPIVDGAPPPVAASMPPLPGAYVPPVAGFAGAAAVAAYAAPGGPAAPARSWAGYGAADVDSTAGATDSTGAPASDRAIDGARVTEFVGWLAIAGGALAAVGFLLPWGASMIGATGVGYLDRWGLAGPFHLVVALAVVALVVSVIVPNRVPAWVRIGLGGTVLGVFMLGLVWPYVFGFSSTGPGALAVGLGAVALVAAGITSLATDRHARRTPPV